jgi:tellurite methyltransferase
MSQADRDRWNHKYAAISPRDDSVGRGDAIRGVQTLVDPWLASRVTRQAATSTGPVPRALELACGLGQTAIYLAQCGYRVDAVDVSAVALTQAARAADAAGVAVRWIEADLDDWRPERAAYDLIVVQRFLDRTRLPEIIPWALKAGGELLYTTFTRDSASGPGNPAFLLERGELRQLYATLEPLEESCSPPPDCLARFHARSRNEPRTAGPACGPLDG